MAEHGLSLTNTEVITDAYAFTANCPTCIRFWWHAAELPRYRISRRNKKLESSLYVQANPKHGGMGGSGPQYYQYYLTQFFTDHWYFRACLAKIQKVEPYMDLSGRRANLRLPHLLEMRAMEGR